MATANHVLLRRITLSTSASSVTFDSIPQTGYTDLKLVISARDSYAAAVVNLTVKFNGSTSGYSEKLLYGNGASASSATQATSSITFNYMPGSTATGSTFGNTNIYIPNYSGSSHKFISSESITENNATTVLTGMTAGLWANSPAITSIELGTLGTAFIAGSSFSLYGIANVNTTPTAAPKADGGDIIKTDGTYWYHAFLTTGTFKPQLNLTCDILQIAGGGGGGAYNESPYPSGQKRGAPGGAGGLLYFASQALTSNTNYTATVGAGGAGITGNDDGSQRNGTQGANSQFASLTASVGGGRGVGYASAPGGNGGSGGGGMAGGAGGTATSGQGFNGGAGDGSFAGGGGGAGAAGQAAVFLSYQGNGGNGLSTYSSWGSATGTGQNISGTYWYAGGGGNNTAGNGGGGLGNTNGVAGTGGGGGGDNTLSDGNSSGNGGSGIIIIRYPVA